MLNNTRFKIEKVNEYVNLVALYEIFVLYELEKVGIGNSRNGMSEFEKMSKKNAGNRELIPPLSPLYYVTCCSNVTIQVGVSDISLTCVYDVTTVLRALVM